MRKTNFIDQKIIDKSIEPNNNFYRYAAGKWLEKTVIPPDKSSWNFFVMQTETTLLELRKILEKEKNSRLGIFYRTALDKKLANKNGINPLNKQLEAIDGLSSKDELASFLAQTHLVSAGCFFTFGAVFDPENSAQKIAGIEQSGLGLPDRDYYRGAEHQAMRNKYLVHLKNTFALLKHSVPQAELVILKIETVLAEASMTNVSLRDPRKTTHKMPINRLAKLSPHFGWNEYFRSLKIKPPKTINVGQPKFIRGFDRIISNFTLKEIKLYLVWHLIRFFAPYLDDSFAFESFDFYQKSLAGIKAHPLRWKKAVAAVNAYLGDDMGKIYVKKHFSRAAKQKMISLAGNLLKAFRVRIKKLEWMGGKTKREALKKLKKMMIKIGYPEVWINYAKLNLKNDSYAANVMRAHNFLYRLDLREIGKPADKKKWAMPPQTVNAYYQPPSNEIVFPAGILQPAMFSLEADDAVNYGAIGTVIAHEITHGFDDQGRKYDSKGNLRDWWSAADAAKFSKKTKGLIAQYAGYYPIDGLHINGELTLGENIADLGGISIAFDALKIALRGKKAGLIDGFTPEQRFFLSFSQIWKSKYRPEYLKLLLQIDPHSPPEYRVNGTLSNLPEFAAAFSGKPKSSDPQTAAKIW